MESRKGLLILERRIEIENLQHRCGGTVWHGGSKLGGVQVNHNVQRRKWVPEYLSRLENTPRCVDSQAGCGTCPGQILLLWTVKKKKKKEKNHLISCHNTTDIIPSLSRGKFCDFNGCCIWRELLQSTLTISQRIISYSLLYSTQISKYKYRYINSRNTY